MIDTGDALNPPPDNYAPTLRPWRGEAPAIVESAWQECAQLIRAVRPDGVTKGGIRFHRGFEARHFKARLQPGPPIRNIRVDTNHATRAATTAAAATAAVLYNVES